MTFADIDEEIPGNCYGIVYQVEWDLSDGNRCIYVGSKVLTGNWRTYKTSSRLCRGYWLVREPDRVLVVDHVQHNADLTNETLHRYLLSKENCQILFVNMSLGRRDHILNKADVAGGRLPGQSRNKSRRNYRCK